MSQVSISPAPESQAISRARFSNLEYGAKVVGIGGHLYRILTRVSSLFAGLSSERQHCTLAEVKTITTREFFRSVTTVEMLNPGQSLAVTQRGKPFFTVTRVGKRPRLSREDLDRRAVKLSGRGGKLNVVRGIIQLRKRGR